MAVADVRWRGGVVGFQLFALGQRQRERLSELSSPSTLMLIVIAALCVPASRRR